MRLQIATFAAFVAGITAAPTPEAALEERDSFRLPQTTILWAMANNTIIGCLNGGGNFTRKRVDYPFRVQYTSGNNNNDGNLYGYSGCSIGSGPLDGAQLNCLNGDQNYLGQFWDRDGFMSVDGPTGTWYSIGSWPDPDDATGVPLTIGGSGGYMQFQLYAKSASG